MSSLCRSVLTSGVKTTVTKTISYQYYRSIVKMTYTNCGDFTFYIGRKYISIKMIFY